MGRAEAPQNVSVVPLRGYLKGKWFCWFQYPHRRPASILASQFLHPPLPHWSRLLLPSLLGVIWLSAICWGDPTANTIPTHKLVTPHMHVTHFHVHNSLCNSPPKAVVLRLQCGSQSPGRLVERHCPGCPIQYVWDELENLHLQVPQWCQRFWCGDHTGWLKGLGSCRAYASSWWCFKKQNCVLQSSFLFFSFFRFFCLFVHL